MLLEVLKEIAKQETHSQTHLAQKLNVDQKIIKQVFYDLQRMGYIVADEQNCADDQCDESGVCCTKNKGKKEAKDNELQTTIIRWKLTDKGQEAIRNFPS